MKKLLVSLMVLVLCIVVLAYPITIIDDVGRPVTILAQPQRIVSVAPMATKFLQYLGFQDKIVGVTNWDDFESERIG
ncbi:MAG: cobalamin-binding protein, partial [Pseudothermotoga sp.]